METTSPGNSWDSYPEKEKQPRLPDCWSLGQLVFKVLLVYFNLRRLEAWICP